MPKIKARILRHLAISALFVFLVVAFSGCSETWKGVRRDLQSVKDTDSWFKDKYW